MSFLKYNHLPLICCLFLQPIHLKGEKYLLKGKINVASSSFDGVNELSENFIVDILDAGGIIIDSTTAGLTSTGNEQTSSVYEFSLWANLGENLAFVPRDPRCIVKSGFFLVLLILLLYTILLSISLSFN